MTKNTNDTIDEVTRFLELVNKHLKEKKCKHTLIEVAKEFVNSRAAFSRKYNHNHFFNKQIPSNCQVFGRRDLNPACIRFILTWYLAFCNFEKELNRG